VSKKSFLLLTILAAFVMGWPGLHFQSIFSQGDIGRDLYTFEQVWRGKLLYRDIWWVYGPLMPYYYGLFYIIFGFKITSILLGKLVINAVAGAFFYLASCLVMSPFWAFLAACYFLQLQQDFFFTYNHIGGIALTLAAFWFILKYLYQGNIRNGMNAVICCFVVGLIKVNFGASALLGTVCSIALIDYFNPSKNKKLLTAETKPFYLVAGLSAGLWMLVYALLLVGMPLYEIRQCMPYFGTDEPYHQTLFQTVPYFITQHYLTFYHHFLNLQNVFHSLAAAPSHFFTLIGFLMTAIVALSFLSHPIVHGSTIASFILSFSKKFEGRRKVFWLTQAIIWLFFVLNFHEFFSSGRWYRTFWSQPFLLFFSFYMISLAMSFSPRWLRGVVAGVWISYFLVLNFINYSSVQASCTPEKFLNMPRGQIYVGNEAPWVDTVNNVTAYLNQNLKKDELFFALPYDCLYYYLTGKPSPSRQIIFFDHIKIIPQQEVSIIQELERNKVNYVLMSNRVTATETGLGIFGRTYCPIIFKYLVSNFSPVYRYGGNWNAEPGTNENHGVIIFKRKNPL
jgi:hypothetical protein